MGPAAMTAAVPAVMTAAIAVLDDDLLLHHRLGFCRGGHAGEHGRGEQQRDRSGRRENKLFHCPILLVTARERRLTASTRGAAGRSRKTHRKCLIVLMNACSGR